MKIHDISLVISPRLPVWSGDPLVVMKQDSSMEAGENDIGSRLECNLHYYFLPVKLADSGVAPTRVVLTG